MKRRWRTPDFRFASASAAAIATSSRYGTGAWKGKRVEPGEMAAKTVLARRISGGRDLSL
jgi:hypothetical protein